MGYEPAGATIQDRRRSCLRPARLLGKWCSVEIQASLTLAWVKCFWGHSIAVVVPPLRDRTPTVQQFVSGYWLRPIVARHSSDAISFAAEQKGLALHQVSVYERAVFSIAVCRETN